MSAIAKRSIAPDIQHQVAREIEAAKNLRSFLGDLAETDEDFARDAVEGETSLNALLARLDDSLVEDETLVAAITARLDGLKSRRDRIKKRIEIKRSLFGAGLEQAGRTRFEGPNGTISRKRVPPDLIIVEESEIPTRYFTPVPTPPPTLDKKALVADLRARQAAFEAASTTGPAERETAVAAALAAHPEIPGVTLSNGGFTIAVKRG